MDVDMDELRDLVKKNFELTQENNRILRGMRSAARWGRFFSILWWVLILAVSGATYYYYLQPYVEKAQQAYANGQNFEQQIQHYLSQLGGGKSSNQ